MPVYRYPIKPLEHGLLSDYPTLHTPRGFSPDVQNIKVDQHSIKNRFGLGTADRDLGTGIGVLNIVLYQLADGNRFTLYLTDTNLINKETGTDKTWSYKTETYTTGDIASITGTAVVGDSASWDGNVAANDYFIMDYDHTADEEPHRVVPYDTGDDGDGDTPAAGDTVEAAGGATGVIKVITIDSGTFAGGDAAGDLILTTCTGTWTDDEVLTFEDGETAAVNGTSIGAWIAISSVTDDDNIVLASDYTVKSNATLAFDSGSEEPSVGDVLDGATSGASGKVILVTKTDGDWTNGGDAEGTITLQSCSGLFNDNEDVDINGGTANVLTVNHADNVAGTDKEVKNGAFVSTTTSWVAGADATLSSESGGQVGNCLKILANGTDTPEAKQADVFVTAGKKYKLSFYHKDIDSTSDNPLYGVYNQNAMGWIKSPTSLTAASSWIEVTYTFTAPTGCTAVRLYLWHTATAGDADAYYFDEVTLYEQPYGHDYKIRKVYSTPSNERWSWAIVDDKFCFTNGDVDVQVWAGSGYASALDATYAIRARYSIEYANRLCIADHWGGGVRDPFDLKVSKNGDPTDWTDSTATHYPFLETEDFITGLGKVAGSLIIFKRESVVIGHKTGLPGNPISFLVQKKGIGCIAPYSIVHVLGTCAWLGNNDFYYMDGNQPRPISRDKARYKFFDIVSRTEAQNTWGFANYLEDEVQWIANTSEGKYAFVWNLKNDEWSIYQYALDLICAGKGAQ